MQEMVPVPWLECVVEQHHVGVSVSAIAFVNGWCLNEHLDVSLMQQTWAIESCYQTFYSFAVLFIRLAKTLYDRFS